MTKERGLLRRALENWDASHCDPIRTDGLMEEIREYLNHFPDATKMVAAEEINTIEVPQDIWMHLKGGPIYHINDLIAAVKKAMEGEDVCIEIAKKATRSEGGVTEATDQQPVAWMFPEDLERFETNETFAQAYSVKCRNPLGSTVPLFLHQFPQAEQRKPLPENEIDSLFNCDETNPEYEHGFRDGIWFCEKHHKISAED
jgi:hypothetical protein